MTQAQTKPLGRKAYGSIGHLPKSRMGSGDHAVPEGYARICCEKKRDQHDRVYVQEKLDGSCVAVAKVAGEVIALGRAGWPAVSSPYLQHRMFADWVLANWERFNGLLDDGERVVGEWLAQAHGTRYKLRHEPFVAFDIMRDDKRMPYVEFIDRIFDRRYGQEFIVPCHINGGDDPLPIESAMFRLDRRKHGAIDPIEGVMYRVERHLPGKPARVDFLAKYVRPDKVDGVCLPEVSGQDPVWNWSPA